MTQQCQCLITNNSEKTYTKVVCEPPPKNLNKYSATKLLPLKVIGTFHSLGLTLTLQYAWVKPHNHLVKANDQGSTSC